MIPYTKTNIILDIEVTLHDLTNTPGSMQIKIQKKNINFACCISTLKEMIQFNEILHFSDYVVLIKYLTFGYKTYGPSHSQTMLIDLCMNTDRSLREFGIYEYVYTFIINK